MNGRVEELDRRCMSQGIILHNKKKKWAPLYRNETLELLSSAQFGELDLVLVDQLADS